MAPFAVGVLQLSHSKHDVGLSRQESLLDHGELPRATFERSFVSRHHVSHHVLCHGHLLGIGEEVGLWISEGLRPQEPSLQGFPALPWFEPRGSVILVPWLNVQLLLYQVEALLQVVSAFITREPFQDLWTLTGIHIIPVLLRECSRSRHSQPLDLCLAGRIPCVSVPSHHRRRLLRQQTLVVCHQLVGVSRGIMSEQIGSSPLPPGVEHTH